MKLSQTFVAAVSTNRKPAVLLNDQQFADLLNWETSESYAIVGGYDEDRVTGYVHTLELLHATELLDHDGDPIRTRIDLQSIIQSNWHKIDMDTNSYHEDVYNVFFFIPAHLLSAEQLSKVFTLRRPTDMVPGTHTRSTETHPKQPSTPKPRQLWLL